MGYDKVKMRIENRLQKIRRSLRRWNMTIGATWEYIVPWKVMFKLWGSKKEHASLH